MWISKEGDVRKQEILDAALQMFSEKGYEGTSINDIIKKVGVTKGAFYYYFSSKEEVLNVLSEKQADMVLEISQKIAGDDRMTALEKLNAIAFEVQGHRAANMAQRLMALKAYQNEINIVLGMKVVEKTIQKGAPVIQSIIEQGIGEGVFNTAFPRETAELYINLSSIVNGSITQILLASGKNAESIEKIRKMLLFYEDIFKRVLGVEKGSVNLVAATLKHF